MYVTRPLSLYRKSPSKLSEEPDGAYSGFLVITDEQAEAEDSFCWGACRRKSVKKLPFPQDKLLTVFHSSDYAHINATKVWFVPVLGQPLSSSRYYVIKAKGRYKGKACTCSREGDMGFCCFGGHIKDRKPKPFSHRSLYQHFKIHRHYRSTFFARSVAPDGITPKFLRKKGWELRVSHSPTRPLSEALGVDTTLRESLPEMNFSLSRRRSTPVIVGNWYCPFIFVRDHGRPKRQMKRSILYKMTLEQYWERIYSCENDDNERSSVMTVNTVVEREMNFVDGVEALKHHSNSKNCTWVWFRKMVNSRRRRMVSVGLSSAIVEKMKMVEEEGGWFGGERMEEARVVREVEIGGERGWRRFGCYVLVESFLLRRMDGKLVLRRDFRHTNRVQWKWE